MVRARVTERPILPALEEQPYTARFAGAASLRPEIEALLRAAPDATSARELRRLVIVENVVAKGSASARNWAWTRLKLRYALDEALPEEFLAFRSAWQQSRDPADRGLICGLMVARTDRLFRDLTLEFVTPHLAAAGTVVSAAPLIERISALPRYGPRDWSPKSQHNMANHVLAALKDFGIMSGSITKRTVTPRPGPVVTQFAARLGRLEGRTDLALLDSPWFRFLGADRDDAVALLREAARAGVLKFRMQAEVVELDLDAA